VAVIAAAGSDPRESFARIKPRLLAAGAGEVELLPLSEGVSEWRGNGRSGEVARSLERFGGVWFTGGDQALILESLANIDGTDTPVLTALRRLHRHGAALGGTSAGAAIMCDPALLGGSGLGDFPGEPALQTGGGLGFFRFGLVDQHFDARGRLLRLCQALERHRASAGFGICENSALLVDHNELSVCGRAGVYIVQTAPEESAYPYLLSYLEKGDLFFPEEDRYEFPSKKSTWGEESLDSPLPLGTGVLSPHGDLRGFIARELLDNNSSGLWKDPLSGLPYVRSFALTAGGRDDPGASLAGYELRFYRDPVLSRGYYDDYGGLGFIRVGFGFFPGEMQPRFGG
jgi:cyanophycinase